MTLRISLGCALLAAVASGACQQTLVLDDLSADASLTGTGGKSGGGNGGSKAMDASTDQSCGSMQQIIATGDVPQVVVALDRSSEMLETQFGGGQNDSEFTVAVSDLSAQVGSYSAPTSQHSSHRAISFAYLEFPENSADCAYPGCCSSVALTTPSYQTFTDATMSCSQSGNSCISSIDHPIAAALQRAQDYFQQLSTFGVEPEERYVLLVTDEAPDGDCNIENDCQFAQDQVNNLASTMNITTVTIHVGTGTTDSTNCLQNFAVTQGAPPSWYNGSELYYPAPMPQDLHDAIASAILAIANGTCRFTLATTPAAPGQLTVAIFQGTMGTTMLQPDSKNGWTYESGSGTPRLTLHGSACSSYLDSQFSLQVYQGCAPDHAPSP